ncbi:MAG: hypothetical protein HEP71_00075 [Roseivirga sp.]|nr:hypothetical protein [Roseivirga sp.]
MRRSLTIFMLLFCLGKVCSAQQVLAKPLEDPRRFIDTAVNLMNQERYAEADGYFMTALEVINVLSADFCFYFGKNSYYLKNYAQSIDWLNKYLELKGSRGQHSKEVLDLLETAEEAFRQNRSSVAAVDVKTRFFYLNTINCSDTKSIVCPVCKGDDIITTKDQLGELYYKACPYSHNGVLTCAQFNLLIQGKLKEKEQH